MSCDTRLDATAMVEGWGADDVPAVMAKDALLVERTISGEAGRMETVAPSKPVAGVGAESATVRVKPESPAVVGVPPICPDERVKPAGREPRTPKV